MKKYIVILFLGVFGLTSCGNDFLEEKMVSTITQDYFDTEVGLEQLINGTYDALRWKYAWEEGPYLFHVGTDAEIKGNNAWDMYQASTFAATGAAGNTYANYLMGYYGKQLLGGYPIINNCNRAVESIREGKALGRFATDKTYAAQRMSEALFTRAWVYYMLVTQLGDVHMTLKSNNSLPSSFNFPKSTSEEIYKQIIGDLRYCFENLGVREDYSGTEGRERVTKGAAAHFLARLYLQRAQGAEFQNSTEPHLKMLYKGNVSTDLDSVIYFTSYIIDHSSDYSLEPDYADIFAVEKGAYPSENSSDIILAASFGPKLANTRYGMRFQCYFTPDYISGGALWGVNGRLWKYGHRNAAVSFSDWGYDVFNNKMADSRYQKSFYIEYTPYIVEGENDTDYYTYNDERNTTQVWTAENAAYFNSNILPTYDRESWGGRQAVADQHKIGRGDLGLVFLENSKEAAIDLAEAKAQPYVLFPRWVKDGNKYYYRRDGRDWNTDYGLDFGGTKSPGLSKHIDINRETVNSEYGSRNVAIFRVGETYLLRAEAYGRKGDFTAAINDINAVRARAAYKPGETRAEVLARLYPGAENLSASERQWPYTVERDYTQDMMIDASYWDGSSANSKAENYPPTANTDLKRFVHFIYNEMTRETIGEEVVYEGIHHAGIQYDRIQYHQQMGSTLKEAGYFPVADNVSGSQGQNGLGKGNFQKFHTFKPFPQNFINLLTDENGSPLDAASRAAYQNPGY